MRTALPISLLLAGALVALGCSDSTTTDTTGSGGSTSATTGTGGTTTTGTGGSTSTSTGTTATTGSGATTSDCSTETTNLGQVVCASNNFLATLTTAELAVAQLSFSDTKARTVWSNLPGVTRNGIKVGAMSATTKTAALALAKTVLTDQGYAHMVGVFAGDDYLASLSGNGPYSSDNYLFAILGTPSATSEWMLQIGGHHMAYNITYKAGVGYPVPHHLGVEPKAQFTVSGNFAGTYQPLEDKGSAMFSVFSGFTSVQLNTAYLSGKTFADVLLGPVEYGTGSLAKVVYPTQTGVLVSSLTSTQQALVTTAIKTWVGDYDASIADPLLAEYTSADAFSKTYLAYGSPTEGSINRDVNTTYLRIDGPRVWLELSCQAGVVVKNVTHFHTIFRDKSEDYGGL